MPLRPSLLSEERVTAVPGLGIFSLIVEDS
jgi:hypothetical protein